MGHECVAEFLGTYVLVFFGVGSVHAAVLTGAQSGLWQVAVVWGIAIALAIYAAGAVSGAHINPAMTLAFATYRGFPVRKVPFYVAAQLAGAFCAAATLYVLFGNIMHSFESSMGIVRGQAGSELSGMVLGEYFPNPAVARAQGWGPESVTLWQAMLAEGIGTAFLAFFVFSVTDRRNSGGPGDRLAPLFIGLAVSIVISIIAPLTQAGLNPARDFGPRLFAWLVGWGHIAIPGPRGGFLAVYILSPMIGALSGAAVYQALVRSALQQAQGSACCDAAGCGCCGSSEGLVQAGAQAERKEPEKMHRPQIVIVGGFLGAGKTTLLWETARRLTAQGRKVGLVTNDQVPDLVDTALLTRSGSEVREVAGSCFCCNFPGLQKAIQSLVEGGADCVLAEPVGSCTDLSATILQPLKDRFPEYAIAPLSVLVDPARVHGVLQADQTLLHADAAYILRLQIAEADRIVLSKADTLPVEELRELSDFLRDHFPHASVKPVSALTGEGVDGWMRDVLGGAPAGNRIVEVDYDRYADGEAVLGWLNAVVKLTATGDSVDWAAFTSGLFAAMQRRLVEQRAEVGHLKALLDCGGGRLLANLTGVNERVSLRKDGVLQELTASLTMNARVQVSPEEMELLFREALDEICAGAVTFAITSFHCIKPGRPQPTYRYDRTVKDGSPRLRH